MTRDEARNFSGDNLAFAECIDLIDGDRDVLTALRDRKAAQFIMKMAALNESVTFAYEDGQVRAFTSLGRYDFILGDRGDGYFELFVDQVI